MEIYSLNNDDYVSDDGDSEQALEMDENNPVVDESLMSTADMRAGCYLDEEDKEDANEEAEGNERKKTRLN
ncbi:hypothetical protein Bca101_019978 [Brassica carinata]